MEFLERVPTVWDDVAVLKAEPGDCVVIARRSENRWFIGGMNDEYRRQMSLSLSFLDKDTPYRAVVFTDLAGSRDSQRNVVNVTSTSTLNIAMEPRGGVAVIVETIERNY
jgi:hypothetical protein